MIGYLSGTIQTIGDKYIIIDVAGVGYRVTLPDKMRYTLAQIGAQIKIYTHFVLNPRDGSVELFGFEKPEELKFFELLTSISGIGPRSAQSILSKAELTQLQLAILNSDDVFLNKNAGLGPKTAQRLIVELKEKMAALPMAEGVSTTYESDNDAVDALVALGYSQQQARDSMKHIGNKEGAAEDKIKEALSLLGNSK